MGRLVGSLGLWVGSLFWPFVDSKGVLGFLPRYFNISQKAGAREAGGEGGGDGVRVMHVSGLSVARGRGNGGVKWWEV